MMCYLKLNVGISSLHDIVQKSRAFSGLLYNLTLCFVTWKIIRIFLVFPFSTCFNFICIIMYFYAYFHMAKNSTVYLLVLSVSDCNRQ